MKPNKDKPNKDKPKTGTHSSDKAVCGICHIEVFEKCNDPMTCSNNQFKEAFNPNY